MGRSANSRNRVFKMKDGILYTDAYDPSRVADPSLIIYNAMRPYEDKLILTNGNQTDTIYDFLKEGKTFEEALATREYEPDDPNYTPRISVLLEEDSYTMSILTKEG
ncbi:MAG: inosine monophosphate cyclohydrolase, partial [Erysipelotrichaceae bacterium]|nr:inosine monophosphate cyclohydrolase [Erysipelotrichaceae bacterium]